MIQFRSREIRVVHAKDFVRPMKGDTRSWLMQADDDAYYVVKFHANPQGPRILINEVVAGTLARELGIPGPMPRIVSVSEKLASRNRTSYISHEDHWDAVSAGLAFGSRLPVNPNTCSIYDHIPQALVKDVANLGDALGILLFDVWVGNVEKRQVVFTPNTRTRQSTGRYRMTMIDNGSCFGGVHWRIEDFPRSLTYWQRESVESRVACSFDPCFSRIRSVTLDQLVLLVSRIPKNWFRDDCSHDEVIEVCRKLVERGQNLTEIVVNSFRDLQPIFEKIAEKNRRAGTERRDAALSTYK